MPKIDITKTDRFEDGSAVDVDYLDYHQELLPWR